MIKMLVSTKNESYHQRNISNLSLVNTSYLPLMSLGSTDAKSQKGREEILHPPHDHRSGRALLPPLRRH